MPSKAQVRPRVAMASRTRARALALTVRRSVCHVQEKAQKKAARQPYHDLFKKWFLSRRNTDIYKNLLNVDKPNWVTIRKTFEANASNTSTAWREELDKANEHLKTIGKTVDDRNAQKGRIISEVTKDPENATPPSTSSDEETGPDADSADAAAGPPAGAAAAAAPPSVILPDEPTDGEPGIRLKEDMTGINYAENKEKSLEDYRAAVKDVRCLLGVSQVNTRGTNPGSAASAPSGPEALAARDASPAATGSTEPANSADSGWKLTVLPAFEGASAAEACDDPGCALVSINVAVEANGHVAFTTAEVQQAHTEAMSAMRADASQARCSSALRQLNLTTLILLLYVLHTVHPYFLGPEHRGTRLSLRFLFGARAAAAHAALASRWRLVRLFRSMFRAR
eukprot:COSAG06_NODE_66_length_26393_cov_6.455161_6_plen_397_part_00